MFECEECKALSEDGKGWIAVLVEDEEDSEIESVVTEPIFTMYCPECAERASRE